MAGCPQISQIYADLLICGNLRHLRKDSSVLRQTPDAAVNVKQQADITQDLELLADFVADMPIIRMEFFQLAGEGVGVGGCKTIGGRSSTTP